MKMQITRDAQSLLRKKMESSKMKTLDVLPQRLKSEKQTEKYHVKNQHLRALFPSDPQSEYWF